MAQYKSGIRTKLNIYHACEKLFYEKGYESTSIQDINDATLTTKSSFYHHFENKQELGVDVYNAFSKRTARTASLFGNSVDGALSVCLNLRTFWHLFYKDKRIRRFIVDMSNINLLHLQENSYIYNACLNLAEHEIDASEIRFIQCAISGITKQLHLDALHLSANDQELSEFNIRYVFNLFDIDKETIDECIHMSRTLFALCTIVNDAFYITARLKHSLAIEMQPHHDHYFF